MTCSSNRCVIVSSISNFNKYFEKINKIYVDMTHHIDLKYTKFKIQGIMTQILFNNKKFLKIIDKYKIIIMSKYILVNCFTNNFLIKNNIIYPIISTNNNNVLSIQKNPESKILLSSNNRLFGYNNLESGFGDFLEDMTIKVKQIEPINYLINDKYYVIIYFNLYNCIEYILIMNNNIIFARIDFSFNKGTYKKPIIGECFNYIENNNRLLEFINNIYLIYNKIKNNNIIIMNENIFVDTCFILWKIFLCNI